MNRIFVAASIVLLFGWAHVQAQANGKAQINSNSGLSRQLDSQSDSGNPEAEQELQKGSALTRVGKFGEAIPHLLAARGRVTNEYAAGFNLALCYVATADYKHATAILNELRANHENADVLNLLAQAYIGDGQDQQAWAVLAHAAAGSPQNEKLYVFVADACTDHQDFVFGLKVVDLGEAVEDTFGARTIDREDGTEIVSPSCRRRAVESLTDCDDAIWRDTVFGVLERI